MNFNPFLSKLNPFKKKKTRGIQPASERQEQVVAPRALSGRFQVYGQPSSQATYEENIYAYEQEEEQVGFSYEEAYTASTPTATPRKPKKSLLQKRSSRSMLLLIVIMLCYGLVLLYSSSIANALIFQDSTNHYIMRQVGFTSFGIVVMSFLAYVDVRFFAKRKFVFIGLMISFALLVIVLIPGIGIVVGGARRWLPLSPGGRQRFQPSEITKIVLIFYLAWHYSRLHKRKMMQWREQLHKEQELSREEVYEHEKQMMLDKDFSWEAAWKQAREEIIQPMIVVMSSVALIMLQAHVSAAIIITLVSLFIMASANLHWRSWLIGAGVGMVTLSILLSLMIIFSAVFPNSNFTQRWLHVSRRLTSFVNAENSSADDKRQTNQALIAIGSGGLTGVGLGQSRQKYLYLAENHNDYIFSIASEELGMIGGLSIIALFVAFLYIGVRIASRCSTMFAQLIAAGCTALIVIQAFFSIGVNVNLLPATGISLPLFSYGGTSNIFFLTAVGIILSISKHGMIENLESEET